ncbi:unnamed protein product [Caenorhabditis bovis]|uniref:BPTI/Kunitz inhibitor domain-containing protein n=1 Tax=Caenorhabditis bovis TaxID=2654633 RepID=A0A8S1EDY2_9PELO|nr:unnamed protein product [Caenorhabditis bovis]
MRRLGISVSICPNLATSAFAFFICFTTSVWFKLHGMKLTRRELVFFDVRNLLEIAPNFEYETAGVIDCITPGDGMPEQPLPGPTNFWEALFADDGKLQMEKFYRQHYGPVYKTAQKQYTEYLMTPPSSTLRAEIRRLEDPLLLMGSMEDARFYDEDDEFANVTECDYFGTDHIEGKIYLIGIFATLIAILSIIFNTFYTIVFIRNPLLRRSGVFYFGVIAVIDIIMAINYIAVMSLPVYMDYYHILPLWHLFLSYFRIVLTESNCAMFASMLMIVLATTERFLKTFDGKNISVCRKFLERNRASVSLLCLLIACAYKYCIYYEIDVLTKEQCEGWARYEIVAGEYAQDENYRFYFMFLTRNIFDRIMPFFALIIMNILIIRAVNEDEERKRQKESVVSNGRNANLKTNRRNVRDATRALISLVSMYLLSQSLQVLLTFWETINRDSLEQGFPVMYSYLNDIVSIFTLLSSCLRFPVYFCCNRLIHTASVDTLSGLKPSCLMKLKKPHVFCINCHLNRDVGANCDNNPVTLKFFFDVKTNVCQPLFYRGCGGNENRFDDRESCTKACVPKKNKKDEDEEDDEKIPSSDKSNLLVVNMCKIPTDAKISEIAEQCDQGCPIGWKCNKKNYCCPMRETVCNLPVSSGSERDVFKHYGRYAYLPGLKNCIRFSYFGKDGNFNNFLSFNECRKYCTSK